MYEQVSHSLLNRILNDMKSDFHKRDLRHFYTRLGANFYAIHSLFEELYGKIPDFEEYMLRLVEVLAKNYLDRPFELQKIDNAREEDHNWFLHQQWVGMALYLDGFAGNLQGLKEKIPYFEELGINLVHIMPILKSPAGKSDGGYAVSDFREINKKAGTLEDMRELAAAFREHGILLTLDVVLNHTSNQHEWAEKTRQGDLQYQDYFFIFEDRNLPDMFEQTMPEVFPDTDPGNFTWDESIQGWVMTVFHDYQWDLNYSNPNVFLEMLDIILFWGNQGADIVRLDAVAFLWKELGTSCQNRPEAHLLLQLFKDCCQITAPGLLFIAEAIVAPLEVIKYFGEDAVVAKECEIAYNATFMALLWEATATHNCKLLAHAIKNLPGKLDRATWLNYVRCHDDIGFGFDDEDIKNAGYDPGEHRRFLMKYLTGEFEGSYAGGQPFAFNEKNGDARVSGTLASLAGLEYAIAQQDVQEVDFAIRRILLLHSLIFSFGGIPLLYYGDEVGTFNDFSYLEDENRADDSRWMHRPRLNWETLARRNEPGTPEHTIFQELRKMIAVRKAIDAFADFNNRELVDLDNDHLFAFLRSSHPRYHQHPVEPVFVLANFDRHPQSVDLKALSAYGFGASPSLLDLFTGRPPHCFRNEMILSPYQFCWLKNGFA
ncbi:MAG: alpha-amylase [Candidatus Electrothrix sp. GM3_4]|nr:alpha-amylase [Candidatus Electrothrix sp. GM3_4]